MTPPPALAVEASWDEGTSAPVLFERQFADDAASVEQSCSVYSEEVLRRAADAVLRSGRSELEMRRLMQAGEIGVAMLLAEAGRTPREELHHAAAEALARMSSSPLGFASLSALLSTHTDPVRRALAARALGYLSDDRPARTQALELALGDADPEVREIAANALSELGDPSALAALRAAVQSEQIGYIAEAMQEAISELEG